MSKRFFGPTTECFGHLITGDPSFKTLQAMANFCNASDIGVVAKWHSGETAFPNGEQLLRLRCFLAILGYEVNELNALEASRKIVAFAIALRLVSPQDATQQLGYGSKIDNTWLIVLRNQSQSAKVDELRALANEHRSKVEDRLSVLSQKYAPPVKTVKNGAPASAPAASDEVFAALDRALATVVALGRLVGTKAAVQIFRQRYGATLNEAYELLGRLTK